VEEIGLEREAVFKQVAFTELDCIKSFSQVF